MKLDDIKISRAIIENFKDKLLDNLVTDVAIVGAGPSSLVAAYYLAKAGRKVVIFERKLAPGGGMWGGGMMFNEIVFQKEAKKIMDEFGIRYQETKKGYFIANFKSVIEPGLLKPVYQAIPDGYVFLSLKGDKPWSINAGKKPPKPGGKIKETFFKASLGLESLDMLREELLFDVEGDFTEVRIENTYIIDEIVVPSDIKNASEARIHAKRKGKIRRKVTVDGVENTTEKEMIV